MLQVFEYLGCCLSESVFCMFLGWIWQSRTGSSNMQLVVSGGTLIAVAGASYLKLLWAN